ncbi:MAG: MBL fold metallo-hydrolase [Patescibacteria group bacterium]|nr:MBL fold metallo-hydrolase [Patescibacteria group bacterium]
MHINWKGESCFQIIISRQRDEQISIIINPFSLKASNLPHLRVDILLLTQDNHRNNEMKTSIKGNPFLITTPGEYEIKDVFIQGISVVPFKSSQEISEKPNEMENMSNGIIVYTIGAEGLRLCHLGEFKQKELTINQISKIGDIDVLMVPIGGVSTISAEEATKIVSQIEPRIVIPMFYEKTDSLNEFLKTMGQKSVEAIDKFSIKKKNLSSDGTKVVVLNH